MPHLLRPALSCLVLALSLAACQRQAPPAEGVGAIVPVPTQAESFELTWQGVLPCADCDGIDTRLVLRREGEQRRFELTETYLGVDADNQFASEGDWVEEAPADADGALYRLDPGGADRRFRLRSDGALDLVDVRGEPAGGPEFRLQRM